MTYVRLCPRCGEARPAEEFVCEGRFQGNICHWSLIDVLPMPLEESRREPVIPHEVDINPAVTPECGNLHCLNGHPLEPGEFMCLVCGEPAAGEIPGSTQDLPGETAGATVRVVNGWALEQELAVVSGESDLFLASRTSNSTEEAGEKVVFKHYRRGIDPEVSLYPALRSLDPDHGARLLDAGRFEDRAFEVWEYLPLGTLGAIPLEEKFRPDFVLKAVREIAGALSGLADVKIIHRDLKPANILVRSEDPLDLVLADFSTATVSEFDLQLTMTRQTTRYAAPETIVGTCSAASDWWSLGVIVLEMLTKGRGFEGVHERAFLLHLVTRGLIVPEDIPEEWRLLLMGLLTREPSKRWGWIQVKKWLDGERDIAHGYHEENSLVSGGVSLSLGKKSHSTPRNFALAAAESVNWDEAKDLLLSGRLATWLQERDQGKNKAQAAQVRTIAGDTGILEDARLAAVLLTLNENLPLCLRGEIITSNWVLSHPDIAISWLQGSLPAVLRRLDREAWFVRLRERADRVRTRLRESGIACEEAQLSAALLATSRSMLESRWQERRRLFPEADVPALASTVERRNPTDEDLIILISVPLDSFRPAADVLSEAERDAKRANVTFSKDAATPWLDLGRREIFDQLNERLRNFVRCGREVADQWADDFRQDRRITLARALVLLSIPLTDWREPPQQEYVRNVLDFFQRRLVTGLQRGGLVRMTIGRTTPRLDLTELGGRARSAEALISTVLSRQSQPVVLDPKPLLSDPQREQRLRRLCQNAATYRRDTGINALYLGFPFVVLRDSRASDASKPRIAPVLLWPVRLDMPAGSRATVHLSFDSERDEVRINPAFEGLLGSAAPSWREVLDDLRGRDHLDVQSILDALSALTSANDKEDEVPLLNLVPLPPATVRVSAGQIQLHASAVLFHSDFSGQTIAEDLKQLAMRPVQGTALEVVIRAGLVTPSENAEIVPAETDRYFTASSDPSQQSAVFRSRTGPGLVVQGPPGTGKSQTIVNIVCDSIGRGEKVLIVCQKLAALEVVRKRLEAEGLSERIFFLKDAVSDRRPALMALRDQLTDPIRSQADEQVLAHERESLGRHIESLETELNGAHFALRKISHDMPGRLSYRQILERLIEVERGANLPISFAPLGTPFLPLDYASAEQVISEVSPLSPLWREAKYENSPLHHLTQFRVDDSTVSDFRKAFTGFRQAETHRQELIRGSTRHFEIQAPEPLQQWLAENERALRELPKTVSQALVQWVNLFSFSSVDELTTADQLIPWLEYLEHRLRVLDSWILDPVLYEKMAIWGDVPLRQLSERALMLSEPPSGFFGKLSFTRWLARRKVMPWLMKAGVDPESVDLGKLNMAANLELELRSERANVQQWAKLLDSSEGSNIDPLPSIRSKVRLLLERLHPVIVAARRVQSCPVSTVASEIWHCGDPQICASVLDICKTSLALWAATRDSEVKLTSINSWFTPEWIASRKLALAETRIGDESLEELELSFPTLPAFQNFRLRAGNLPPLAFELFSLLRERGEAWERFPAATLPEEVARTLKREALLAWKAAAEQRYPALLMERNEFDQKITLLGKKDVSLREANRKLLSKCSPRRIASRDAWDDVVMLTGPRRRSMREVVERGNPLGLFDLRPVWMVNPEMASRLFPLQAGLFDVVIFDEASQLPVESVLPALFRARRVVVSGDEKQMPPSKFFGSRLDSDEEESEEEWIDSNEEEPDSVEKERINQTANRREVKDCTDLLTLTQNLLPTATLEIHYRSKYRQLIDYSNAAFYSGRLNIPARHPVSEILRAKPIEVDRVNGCYSGQTNETEANRVVVRLQEIWRLPVETRPSIGVVTFNLKQADLIQDKLETLAEEDESFRKAWELEQARTQRGEDMGFFVKNLENVQGDERDWIIFSTTFGRNESGTFIRNFGVLGQQGGERRLNVAVTRAREKILLITSLPVNEISTWTTNHGRRPPSTPRDFIQGWVAYAERIHAGELEIAGELLQSLQESSLRRQSSRSLALESSPVAEEVAAFLRQLGHAPVEASGDAFGVDFALVDSRTDQFGLGIECDAPFHPVLASARARELWRPSVLAASIPFIHRVTSRAWYHDRTGEQNRLEAAVNKALHQTV